MTNQNIFRIFAAIAIFAAFPLAAMAISIVPSYNDGAGQTWTAERKAVIQEAINEWQTALSDNRTVRVTFDFTHAGTDGYLGEWNGSYSGPSGINRFPWTTGVTHAIHFNVDDFSGEYFTWWDSTPATDNDLNPKGWDALSVARHEMGHMLGFTDNFYKNAQNVDKWTMHISGTTFDPGGMNVAMDSAYDLAHLYDNGTKPGDLMVPILYNGIRRDISVLDLNMLHLAYNYTVVPPVSPTTYTLVARTGKAAIHLGDTCSITALITNAGTGSADTLDFTGLNATASGGTIGGSSSSGGPLANGGGNASDTGLTFTSTTAGSFTITPRVTTATNHSLNTSATLSGTTAATVTVYSGQGVWNLAGSGSWTALGNWTALGGTPGIDGALSASDTATFSSQFSGSATISLNGATPRLAGLTFDTPNGNFIIAPGTGGNLTLQAPTGQALLSVLHGTSTIRAPLILGSDAKLAGPGSLIASGGISGNHSLTVTGTLTASSIRIGTLANGSSSSTATVPEPAAIVLLGIGALGLFGFARRRRD